MSFFDYREGSQSISSTLAFFYHTMEDKVMPLEANRHERTISVGRKEQIGHKKLRHSEDMIIRGLFDKGLTQAEIARTLGRHKSTIHYWQKRNKGSIQ